MTFCQVTWATVNGNVMWLEKVMQYLCEWFHYLSLSTYIVIIIMYACKSMAETVIHLIHLIIFHIIHDVILYALLQFIFNPPPPILNLSGKKTNSLSKESPTTYFYQLLVTSSTATQIKSPSVWTELQHESWKCCLCKPSPYSFTFSFCCSFLWYTPKAFKLTGHHTLVWWNSGKGAKETYKEKNVPPDSLFSLNNDYPALPDLLEFSQSQPYNYPIKALFEC